MVNKSEVSALMDIKLNMSQLVRFILLIAYARSEDSDMRRLVRAFDSCTHKERM